MRLYLIREPRALVLSSDSGDYCLVFRRPPADSTGPSVVVELLPADDVALEAAVLLNGRVSGCLGVLRIAEDTFLPFITSSTSISSHTRHFSGVGTEPISRILSVEFFCLTSSTYDSYSPLPLEGAESYDDHFSNPGARGEPLEHPCAGIRKILSNSSIYFSSGENAFDLSTRLEARLARKRANEKGKGAAKDDGDEPPVEEYDTRFLWNTFLIAPLLSFRASLASTARTVFDQQGFIVLAIQGFCGLYDISLGGQPAVLSLLSRLGWKRAGTRFNVRGVDDDGSVANFVETETILRTATLCFSYTQIRGSVPVFWEEVGVQPFGLKITVTRPIEASLPAFLRHFEELLDNYSSIHIINLLSSKDQEASLTAAYEAHLAAAALVDEDVRDRVRITEFDFHAKSRVGGIESVKSQLANAVGEAEAEYGSCLISIDRDGEGTLVMGQRGVFRTNCKDCLDRTNVVEDVLSRFALEDFIRNTNPAWSSPESALWSSHRILFAENGDALSKIYVGTGAINTSFTRSGKKSFAGLLSDATKSVGRMYQSNFLDTSKQVAIDALLGYLSSSQKVRVFNPVNDALHESLQARASEYTSYEPIWIWVGTYNLNGKGPGTESLLAWLFPADGPEPGILVVAFQEIVPLTPQMIMATDPEKKRRWEAHILKTVADRPDKKADYILLRSGQLVGTALIVLIQKSLANEVRNVEVATKKTGLNGMAGNKGAVAIRLDYRDSSFCFVTAHLAAGHSNVDERNNDYFTITEGLHFSKGKTIANHENVIWAADTNYRISFANDEVRRLAAEDDYAALMAGDQLSLSMRTRNVFSGFTEGPLIFPPTYKYDNGTQNYDTSEKQRIPAWTDRILYSGNDLDLSRYYRAELLASDHRPVYAVLRARIRTIDHGTRAALRKEILKDILVHSPAKKFDVKLSRITNGVAAIDLPPPSNDEQAWWKDSNHPHGLVNLNELPTSSLSTINPFNAPHPRSSSQLSSHRKPPPIVPSKSSLSTAPSSRRKPPPPAPRITISLQPPEVSWTGRAAPPISQRPKVSRSPSASSLLDSDEDSRESKGRKGAGGWEVIPASQH